MSDEWIETTLAEVSEVVMGQSPPGSSYNESGDGLPFIQGSAEFGVHHPSPVKWCSSPRKVANSGDILLSVRAPVGDTNVAAQRIAVGRGLAIIGGTDRASSAFLRFTLEASTNALADRSDGGMFASITGANLRSLPISLPPLSVQARIVDLLEHLDTLIANLEQERDAAEGLLTAVRDSLTIPGPDWSKAGLVELTSKIGSGATPRGGQAAYVASGTPLIRSQNVYDGHFEVEGLAHITDAQARLLDGVTVHAGDILINITGASVNRTCVVPDRYVPARVNQHVAILRVNPMKMRPDFLHLWLRRSDVKQSIDVAAGAGTTRQALTKTYLEGLLVDVPPMDEQARIAVTVGSIASVVSSLAVESDRLVELRKALLSALLSREIEIPESYDELLGVAS